MTRRSRQESTHESASLDAILSHLQDLEVGIIQEEPDRTDGWRAWTIQSGGRTCRIERPRVEFDRCDVLDYTRKNKPVREVEYTHDTGAIVPCHWWLVNSGGRGSGTLRTAVAIASGIRAVLSVEEAS